MVRSTVMAELVDSELRRALEVLSPFLLLLHVLIVVVGWKATTRE